MSLDVYLTASTPPTAPNGGSGIFVRRNGQTVEMSRQEWVRTFPDQEPVPVDCGGEDCTVYSANITHNLNKMASAAGLYKPLWRPEEIGVATAGQLIEPLGNGLGQLLARPDDFKRLNPPNGWGDYDGLVIFVRDYLAACQQHPDAAVSVSR